MRRDEPADLLALPTAVQHASWLRAKRRQLTRLLGGFPSKEPLNAHVRRRQEEGDRVVEWVEYEVERGEVARAILSIPRKGTPPLPAVVCHHQHAGQYELGKSEVVGWEGNPQQAYAAELCSRGFVTLAADCIGFEERGHPSLSGAEYERFLAHEYLLKGLTLQGKMIWDVMRAVDYLGTREEVDARRIGIMGHSLGAVETWFSMALEPRLAAGTASCGTTTYAAVLAAERYHNYGFYVPGILKWGDISEVVSMVAPRPLLILAGEKDAGFPIGGAREVAGRAKMLYRRVGKPDALELVVSSGGHEFSDEMRKRAYHWFDRWLVGDG